MMMAKQIRMRLIWEWFVPPKKNIRIWGMGQFIGGPCFTHMRISWGLLEVQMGYTKPSGQCPSPETGLFGRGHQIGRS